MPKYRKIVPSKLQDQLDAARSPNTPQDVLDILTEVPNSTLQAAIAENPNASPSTLAGLVPINLQSVEAQLIATALAKNNNTPSSILERIVNLINPLLTNKSVSDSLTQLSVALCCNLNTPSNAVETLLNNTYNATRFREIVATETRRRDVLNLLAEDNYYSVRQQVLRTMQSADLI